MKKLKEIVHEYSLFVGATSHQKELIISTLKESGHNVGYVEDGVNDFSSIPKIINEGRRTINNIKKLVYFFFLKRFLFSFMHYSCYFQKKDLL